MLPKRNPGSNLLGVKSTKLALNLRAAYRKNAMTVHWSFRCLFSQEGYDDDSVARSNVAF